MSSPNYTITLFLCLSPFGWFGVQHMYLGNRIRGALYFLFFWTLIPAILSLIEGVQLMRNGRDRFIQKYGTKKDLEEYHYEKLKEHNPELALEVQDEFTNDDSE